MSNMVVNTNILAINAHRNLSKIGVNQAKASSRLASGLRVNSAADDAAGLAISEKMRAQIRGLDQATRNTQDGISLIQTAEGGMQEIDNMVIRIRELVVQAANDTNDQSTTAPASASGDRQKIQNEINQLMEEIDSMAERVEFNNKKLINGDFATTDLYFQVGANKDQGISLKINSVKCKSLGLSTASTYTVGSNNTIDLVATTGKGAITGFLADIDAAIKTVTDERAKLGAVQNRMEYTMNSLKISSENLSAAESRIRDADMAKEMMSLVKSNVLQQAATSMLAQANQAPQSILQLLQ